MSHNTKYYRKRVDKKTVKQCRRISDLFNKGTASFSSTGTRNVHSESSNETENNEVGDNSDRLSVSQPESSAETENIQVGYNSDRRSESQPTSQDTVEHIQTPVIASSSDVSNNEVEQDSCSAMDKDNVNVKNVNVNPVSKIDNRLSTSLKYELQFPWIYFSSAKWGYICKYCEFWDKTKTSESSTPFVSTGAQLGDHPGRKLRKHESSENHQLASKMYNGECYNSKSVYNF